MLTITTPAAELLKQIMKENGADGLIASLQQTCCSAAPVFQMVRFEEGDEPVEVNGISVLIEDEAKPYCEEAIIDLDDGELMVFMPSHGGCGCHHDHDHEGGCCHGEGHHHDHEGGCCHGEGHHHDHEGGCCHGEGHDHDHEGCCHGEGHHHDGGCCH